MTTLTSIVNSGVSKLIVTVPTGMRAEVASRSTIYGEAGAFRDRLGQGLRMCSVLDSKTDSSAAPSWLKRTKRVKKTRILDLRDISQKIELIDIKVVVWWRGAGTSSRG